MLELSSMGIPEILYIMGLGRSGTTILEVLLTNSPGISSAGEVTHVFRDGFSANENCACGQPALQCPVWGQVFARCGWTRAEVEEIQKDLQRVEDHARFPLTAAGLIREPLRKRYKRVNAALFAALGEIHEGSTIVDSSKYAGRALALYRAFPERVKVLCVTRSPAGLMSSFRKPHEKEQVGKSPLGTVEYYSYVVACLVAARRQLGDSVLQVCYDDLIADPASTLERIENWSGLDLSASREKIANGQPLDIGHIVTGNRLRKKGQVRFDPSAGHAELEGRGARMAVRFMEFYGRVMGELTG